MTTQRPMSRSTRPAGGRRRFGAQSAVGPLRRALVRPPCWSPEAAACEDPAVWKTRWGYTTPPDLGRACEEHAALVDILVRAGVEVEECRSPRDALYDSVFACDWGVVTDAGAVVFAPGKEARQPEADLAEEAFRDAGVPVLHRMRRPATAEGGDLLWLAPDLLLVGRSYRTNASGLDELRALLGPLGVTVVPAPVVHGQGPGSVMHLLSAISLVDVDLAVAYLPVLAVETVEFLRARGIEFVEVPDEEYPTLGCNVLALAPRHCVVAAGNPRVRRDLERRGVAVEEFPARELGLNMGGGPTCLVQALLRDYP
ncbi:MAG TPA: arginine deiminase [Clostridiales bacterium]|nr:arginine deiminase [Clostridiales bacterium]